MEMGLQVIGSLFVVVVILFVMYMAGFTAGCARRVNRQERAFQAQIDSLRESIGTEARKRRSLEFERENQRYLIKRIFQAVAKDRKAIESFRSSLKHFQHETRNHGAQMVSLREDVGEYMIKVETVEERMNGVGGELASCHDHIEQVENVGDRSLRNLNAALNTFMNEQNKQGREIHALKVGKANKVTPQPNKSPRAKNSKAARATA